MGLHRRVIATLSAGLAGCGATAIGVAHRADAGAVATVAPGFRLPSHRGGEVASAVALARRRVALVFYRGFW